MVDFDLVILDQLDMHKSYRGSNQNYKLLYFVFYHLSLNKLFSYSS